MRARVKTLLTVRKRTLAFAHRVGASKGLLAVAATVALLLLTHQYVRAYRIHGPSDAPNYLWGDVILVNRAAYDLRLPLSTVTLFRIGAPKRGDAVLLRLPDADYDVTRRVIGLPGDTIEVRESRVILNEQPLAYDAVRGSPPGAVDLRNRIGSVIERERAGDSDYLITYTPGECGVATTEPVVVPEGHYYVLGDNRDHCTDSRRLGPIRREHLRGRILGTVWSRR